MAPRRCWLMKSEPSVYSIQDLAREKDQTTCLEGVRNHRARNLLRDEIKEGDGVLFHHSNAKPPHVAGTAVVVREGYPDHYARRKGHRYYDPKATKDNPIWYMVDIRLDRTFKTPLTLDMLREVRALGDMMLLQRGMRLSVQPVTPEEWRAVLALADRAGRA